MKVLIDGKEVEVQNDVKIIWEQEDDDENEQTLQLTATYEGLIGDVFDEEGELIQTASIEHQYIMGSISIDTM